MKISIITTTYNRKDYLLKTIESVQKSILSPLKNVNWEHIIYDDASSDGTHELFMSHNFKNTFYFRGEKNKGPSFGKNCAIAKSTGEYIFIIDSDDVLFQRTLYHFADCALNYPDSRWFVCDFLRIDEDGRYKVGEDYYAWKFKNPQEMLETILKGEHFIQGNSFFKKALFDKAGGFDEKIAMAEDLDLFIRFLREKEMPRVISCASHLHRIHSNNLSKGVTGERHKKTALELRMKYYQNSATPDA